MLSFVLFPHKNVSKLGVFFPLKIFQHVAILINQHCQHKTSFPAHTKVKQQLTTKKGENCSN